jgi:hypothetical protein
VPKTRSLSLSCMGSDGLCGRTSTTGACISSIRRDLGSDDDDDDDDDEEETDL